MLSKIEDELAQIERDKDVRILLAVESGSRAWGFASPDSDYDVRFVYARRPESYLQINEPRDVIEWKLDDVLDINGWDVRKTLRLLRNSNPSILEWLSSPIVYRSLIDGRLAELGRRSFNPVKSCYHYLNMAKRNVHEHLEADVVKLKKYLYVIRAILAAQHVLDAATQPPMLFDDLVEEQADAKLAPLIANLLDQKRAAGETVYISKCEPLNEWIIESLAQIEDRARAMPRHAEPPWDDYNALFLDLIRW